MSDRAESGLPASVEVLLLRGGLREIAALIERTRIEVAGLAIGHEPAAQLATASGELDAVVDATETAAEQIMSATERMQDRLARLRLVPLLPDTAAAEIDAMEADATGIVMACSFQDLTGQRIRRVVRAITYIEARVRSLAALWQDYAGAAEPAPLDTRPEAALMHGPRADGLCQTGVDALLAQTASSQADIDRLFG